MNSPATVDADSVWVLGPDGLQGVMTRAVLEAKLTVSQSYAGRSAGFTAVGVLSTASHGLLAAVTAPLWLIVGSSATAAESRVPERKGPPMSWEDLRAFARFPAGWPSGLDRDDLKGKPVPPQ